MNPFLKHIGFTKGEIKVIIFIVLIIISGFTIKYYKHLFGESYVNYNYSKSDSEFLSKSNSNLTIISDSTNNKRDTSVLYNENETQLYQQLKSSDDSINSGQKIKPKKSKKELNLKEKSININTVGKDSLLLLPGVGESTAEKIILFREKYNGFKTIEDIMKIKGIGKKKFEKMKVYITID